MNWTVTFYTALLFFILTPAILVRLPPKGNKYTVAAFHALVFALVFHFTGKMVWRLSSGMEGFREGATTGSCTLVGDGKGSGLQPPNNGAGGANCVTVNNDYCTKLVFEGKPAGYYSYDTSTHLCKQASGASAATIQALATQSAQKTAAAATTTPKQLSAEQLAALRAVVKKP